MNMFLSNEIVRFALVLAGLLSLSVLSASFGQDTGDTEQRLRFFVGLYEFKHVAPLQRMETSRRAD